MTGGKRTGAGRPPGAKSVRSSREVVQRRIAAGLAKPLDVILDDMDMHVALAASYRRRGDEDKRIAHSKLAREAAESAAPYFHPRIQAIAVSHQPEDPIRELLKQIDGTTRGLPSDEPLSKVIN
jgi:hypothetical protein